MSSDDESEDPSFDASRWFRFAEEDLLTAVACVLDQDVPPRQACYFAQQAAEKALKACLIACGRDYPRSHDLNYLRTLLPPQWRVHETHSSLAELTEWLVEARYPGDWPDATEAEARSTIETATGVLAALRTDLDTSIGLAEFSSPITPLAPRPCPRPSSSRRVPASRCRARSESLQRAPGARWRG